MDTDLGMVAGLGPACLELLCDRDRVRVMPRGALGVLLLCILLMGTSPLLLPVYGLALLSKLGMVTRPVRRFLLRGVPCEILCEILCEIPRDVLLAGD